MIYLHAFFYVHVVVAVIFILLIVPAPSDQNRWKISYAKKHVSIIQYRLIRFAIVVQNKIETPTIGYTMNTIVYNQWNSAMHVERHQSVTVLIFSLNVFSLEADVFIIYAQHVNTYGKIDFRH